MALLGLCAAAPASAQVFFTRAWGWGVRDGASQFQTCTITCQSGVAGGGAGQLSFPDGVAVDGSGDVFVADLGNNRVDEFSSSGGFIKAWGWGVADGQSQFETCTTTCQQGISGGGAGQLAAPRGVAVDASGDVFVASDNDVIQEFSSSGTFIRTIGSPGNGAGQLAGPYGVAVDGSGNVFVADQADYRVVEFSSSGAFIKTWGWGVADGQSQFETCTATCQSGLEGSGAGQLGDPYGIAVDGSGHVFVGDYCACSSSEGFLNHRIDEFSSSGAFIKAWGWGVLDGKNKFETCTTTCEGGIGGDGAGQITGPLSLAVNGSGDVIVLGPGRIDDFSPAGAFIKGWGWGVLDGKNQLETCTTTCRGGIGGSGAGRFLGAYAAAADQSGDVFVADVGNSRIDEFGDRWVVPVVYAGYADGFRQGKVSAPSPWQGSPGVIFKGCNYFRPDRCPTTNSGADLYDAGAIRIDNTTGTNLTVTKASVTIGSCTLDPWPALKVTVPAGEQLILTQTGGTAPCHLREGKRNFDTSDTSHSCTTSDHLVPRLHVGIDGAVESFSDRSEILNTGGLDVGDKACGSHNETHSWGMMSRPPT